MEVPCCMDSEISAENSVRKDKGYLGAELKQLARNYECKILEGHLMSVHVHILIAIPPLAVVNDFVCFP